MATAKKTAPKKTAAKKAPAKKVAAKKTTRKAVKRDALSLKPIKEKMNRTALTAHLMDKTGLAKKEVNAVLAALSDAIKASVMPKGVGVFQIPGVLNIKTRKIAAKKMPAIKKGTLVRRPGSTEPVEHPGRAAYVKPATTKVRVIAMAQLKRAALGTE